jgi:hypothetical protein
MQEKFKVAESLSVSTTSYSRATGAKFPFVTVPQFERQSQKARELSGAEAVILVPLVNRTLTVQWSEYAQTRSSWVQEGLAVQGLSDINPGPVPFDVHPYQFDEQGDEHPGLEDMVAPWW